MVDREKENMVTNENSKNEKKSVGWERKDRNKITLEKKRKEKETEMCIGN